MHSHHSHSGQYVSHAVDDLESIVLQANNMGFTHFCLTEHMPRFHDKFLYLEEKNKQYTYNNLIENFNKYLKHAIELQKFYNKKNGLKLLIGLEIEGLDDEHIEYAKGYILNNSFINMTVGSVHFINGIAIDYSKELWFEARNSIPEKTTRGMYNAYFELQYKVISTLKPIVIGHFDLVRLFEPIDEIDPTTNKPIKEINLKEDWPEIWKLIIRNISVTKEYGGLFELNSAAIRKGWACPYPKKDISEAIIKYGDGRFCLSDDSHAIKQVGLSYHKTWDYIKNALKLEYIYHLDLDKMGKTIVKKIPVKILDKSEFWRQY